MDDFLNVKDYGAAGDGSTNDTAAVNLAITAQGIVNPKALYFPKGDYLISTNALGIIYGSVYGPDATIIAADGNNNPIFRLHYRDNGAEKSFKTFDLLAIQGYGYHLDSPNYVWPNRIGSAIYVIAMDYSEVRVKEIAGFEFGVWLDGVSSNLHQGVNSFDFRYIHTCAVGIFMNAGNVPSAYQEASHFKIGYMQDFTTACIYLGGGVVTPNLISENVFDIVSMAPNHANADGIVCTSLALRNEFNVRSWDRGVSGTGRLIRSTGSDNVFRVPYANFSTNIDSQGQDIWDMRSNATDGTGRSDITSTRPPSCRLLAARRHYLESDAYIWQSSRLDVRNGRHTRDMEGHGKSSLMVAVPPGGPDANLLFQAAPQAIGGMVSRLIARSEWRFRSSR